LCKVRKKKPKNALQSRAKEEEKKPKKHLVFGVMKPNNWLKNG